MYDVRDIPSPPGVALVCSGCSVLDSGVGISLCNVQQSLGALGYNIIMLLNLTNHKEKIFIIFIILYLFSVVALKSFHCSMLCS